MSYLSNLYEICHSKMNDIEFKNSFNNGVIVFFPHFANFLLKEIPLFSPNELKKFSLGLIEHDFMFCTYYANNFFFNSIRNEIPFSQMDAYNHLLDDKRYGVKFFTESIYISTLENKNTVSTSEKDIDINNDIDKTINYLDTLPTHKNNEAYYLLKKYIDDMLHPKQIVQPSQNNGIFKIFQLTMGINEMIDDFKEKSYHFCHLFLQEYLKILEENKNLKFEDIEIFYYLDNNLNTNINDILDNEYQPMLSHFPYMQILFLKYGNKIIEKFKDNKQTLDQIDINIFPNKTDSSNYCSYIFYKNNYQKYLNELCIARKSDDTTIIHQDIDDIFTLHNHFFSLPIIAQVKSVHNGTTTSHNETYIEPTDFPSYLLDIVSQCNKMDNINNLHLLFFIISNNINEYQFVIDNKSAEYKIYKFISILSSDIYDFQLPFENKNNKDDEFDSLFQELQYFDKIDLHNLYKVFEHFSYNYKSSQKFSFMGINGEIFEEEQESEISSNKNTLNLKVSENYDLFYHMAQLIKENHLSILPQMQNLMFKIQEIELERDIPIQPNCSYRVKKF